MKIAHKVSVLLLSIVFLGLILFSIWYVPDRRDSLYKSMPADIDFVSVHARFAERSEALLENSMFRSLAEATGIAQHQLDALLSDPEGRYWLERIASDRIVIGHVPPGVFSSEPAWGLAAWLGSSSIGLRWQLDFSAPKDTRIGAIAGTKVWRFDLPDLPEGQRLFCAVKEGFLLLALSDSSAMIQSMILASQGRAVSALDFNPEWTPPDATDLELKQDMFWVFDRDGWGGAVKLAFSGIYQNTMRGNLSFPGGVESSRAAVAEVQRPIASPWRGPMAYAVADRNTVRSLVEIFEGTPTAAVVGYLADAIEAETAFVGLFGEQFQGRLLGFRVPGVLVAVPCEDRSMAIRTVFDGIDLINADYSAGIIYSRVAFGGHDVYFVQGSRDNLYGSLPASEQIVFTHRNGFLFIASNHILIESIARGELFFDAANQIWPLGYVARTGYAWLDLQRSARAINLILSVYRLRLIAENPRDFVELRRRFDLIGDWVEAFSEFGEALLWTSGGSSNAVFEFEVGTKQP